MAVKGKKEFRVYLDEETTQYVRSFLETTRFKGGLSGYFDSYLKTTAKTLKAAEFVEGKKLTVKQLLKFGLKGLQQEPL